MHVLANADIKFLCMSLWEKYLQLEINTLKIQLALVGIGSHCWRGIQFGRRLPRFAWLCVCVCMHGKPCGILTLFPLSLSLSLSL